MRKTLPIFILLFAVSGYSQTITQKLAKLDNPRQYNSRYDKFKDQTTIGFVARKVLTPEGKTLIGLGFTLSAVFQGTEPSKSNAEYAMIFVRVSLHRPASSQFIADNAILLADGKRIMLDGGMRDSNSGQSTFGLTTTFSEGVMFHLSKDEMETISNAKKVEFQVSGIEGMFDDITIRAFKNIQLLSK